MSAAIVKGEEIELREWAELKGNGQSARDPNGWGRASGGGKLTVNGLRRVAGGKGDAAKGGSLKVLDPSVLAAQYCNTFNL